MNSPVARETRGGFRIEDTLGALHSLRGVNGTSREYPHSLYICMYACIFGLFACANGSVSRIRPGQARP